MVIFSHYVNYSQNATALKACLIKSRLMPLHVTYQMTVPKNELQAQWNFSDKSYSRKTLITTNAVYSVIAPWTRPHVHRRIAAGKAPAHEWLQKARDFHEYSCRSSLSTCSVKYRGIL
jgi:hypothetical protein